MLSHPGCSIPHRSPLRRASGRRCAIANEIRIKVTADDQASKKLDGIKTAFGDIAKIAGGIVVAQGLSKLPGLFTSATDSAIALGESTNAVQQIFDDSAQDIIDWGKANANAFGLARSEFQQMATPLGAMLKNAGLDMDDVTDSTIDLTKRAADMASVFNTDVGDALGAIQAGLRGEADPLERYGVSLKAAAVEAKALAMTGKDAAKSLTEQEKAAARVALILEQTNDVQGDFVATSDQAANAARIQAAKQEELAAQIGTHLLPVQLKLTEAKLKLVEVIATKVLPAIEQFVNVAGPAIREWWEQDVKPALDNLEKAWREIWPIVKPFIDQLIAGITLIGSVVGNTVQIITDLLAGDFSGAWENAKDIMRSFETFFGDTIDNVKEFVSELGPRLFELAKDAFNKLQDGISNVWATRIWPWMKDLPGNILDALGDLASILFDAGKQIITGLWDGMKSVWGGVEDWLGGLGGKIQGLKGPIEKDRALLLQQGKAIMQGLGAGMEEGWGKYVEKMLRHKTEQLAEMGAKMAGVFSPSGDPNARMSGATPIPGGGGETWENYWNNQGGFTSIDHIAMNRALAANESTRGMVGQGVQIILQGPGMAQLANDITIEQSGAFR